METQVVVVGGGITGTGVLRDLAMRGVDAVLVEKGDLANGTSAAFHGLLHSGARYAVTDSQSARECITENRILKRIASGCIDDIGGYFVHLEGDDPAYVDRWHRACRENGIHAEEVDPQELLRQEPNLSSQVQRAFHVPDAAVDGFRLVQENALSAMRYGARVLTYTAVVGIECTGGQVRGVTVHGPDGHQETIRCQAVVNAAGPWAGEIASLAGVELEMLTNKGTLLVFNHRLTGTIINRCAPPGNGDIFVPHHTVTIYGTTSRNVCGPGWNTATSGEARQLFSIGRKMIPALDQARVLRAFAGVRPLYQPALSECDNGGRQVTRSFFVIDHAQRDGLQGLVSIIGGKLTTYRLMAEKTVDVVAAKLGVNVPCSTALEPLDSEVRSEPASSPSPAAGQILCECEQVSEDQLRKAMVSNGIRNLNDLRRRTRMGMGTCQGTTCTYRALGMVQDTRGLTAAEAGKILAGFLAERWKGMRPVLWGQTLQEAELMRQVYADILHVEGLSEK